MWSMRTAEQLRKTGEVEDIVLVVPSEYEEKVRREASSLSVTIAAGGASRSESVINGLRKCSGSHVLIHDGARPFASVDLCRRLTALASEDEGVIPLLKSSDSLKMVDNDRISSVDRNLYYRTQTPQLFPRDMLIAAMEKYGSSTDEASLWLAAGEKLRYIDGEEMNFKITTPFDWETAKLFVENNIEKRTGYGYDIHQLAEGRPLIIAGVKVEGVTFGLLGHSDADLVAHAVMDALLGAAGEPDIGTLFPASDEKWRGADSIMLLRRVLALLEEKGWRVEWVDVTLIAQRPRLGAFVPEFIENMNRVLGGDEDRRFFNMKVKSAENCGSAGRGECMICHAVGTISRVKADHAVNI